MLPNDYVHRRVTPGPIGIPPDEVRFGNRVWEPSGIPQLAAVLLSVRMAARACAVHDEGAVVVTLVSNPDRRIGIGFCGHSTYDPNGSSMRSDPVMVEAARRYLRELTLDWVDGDDLESRMGLPGYDPDLHAEAAAYVAAQWPRIIDLTRQLLQYAGAINDPEIMPPFTTEDSRAG
jgi:hypothetical protein